MFLQIKKVSLTLSGPYQWAIRFGTSSTSLPSNQYWYNSGDTIEVVGNNTMMLVLRKVTDTNYTGTKSSYELTISDADLEGLNLKMFFYSE